MPARLVVLASGSGTTVQALIDDPTLRPSIVAVGSDKHSAPALARAQQAGVPAFTVPFAEHPDRGDWNRALEAAIGGYEPDLVVLAGFMRIVDAGIVSRFRVVNTHPALLPAFPGAHAIRDALAAGATETGVTVHWVDEGVDTGPVIAQARVAVHAGDDEASLRARVQAAEKPLYLDTLRTLVKEYM